MNEWINKFKKYSKTKEEVIEFLNEMVNRSRRKKKQKKFYIKQIDYFPIKSNALLNVLLQFNKITLQY